MSPTLPYISEQKVKKILTPSMANQCVENAFKWLGQGKVQMPPKVYLNVPKGDFRAMPAAYFGANKSKGGMAGMKWICVFPQNSKRKLPAVIGMLVLNDMHTGQPLAIMEANHLTACRTGAAGAVATKFLAHLNASQLLLVGAGVQAEFQLKCHLALKKQYSKIMIWSKDYKDAVSLAKKFKSHKHKIIIFKDLAAATRQADIICTCTPSTKALIKKTWLKPNVHINAIGADAPGKQELDMTILKQSHIFVDDWEQASHSGEINKAISRRQITKKDIAGTISQAVLKTKRSTSLRRKGHISIFDSTGLAIQDLVLAQYVYSKAV